MRANGWQYFRRGQSSVHSNQHTKRGMVCHPVRTHLTYGRRVVSRGESGSLRVGGQGTGASWSPETGTGTVSGCDSEPDASPPVSGGWQCFRRGQSTLIRISTPSGAWCATQVTARAQPGTRSRTDAATLSPTPPTRPSRSPDSRGCAGVIPPDCCRGKWARFRWWIPRRTRWP